MSSELDTWLCEESLREDLLKTARSVVGSAAQMGMDFLAASDALIWGLTDGRSRLLERPPSIRRAYLLGVCRRRALSLLRRAIFEREVLSRRADQNEADLEADSSDPSQPERSTIAREQWELLHALCLRNPQLSSIIEAKTRNPEITVGELARRLEISERTVYRELRKAREAIDWPLS